MFYISYRGILENAGAVFSQRTLQWDMSGLYPGLAMKIGPSHGTTGLLEFVMTPNGVENDRSTYDEPPTTGKVKKNQKQCFRNCCIINIKKNIIVKFNVPRNHQTNFQTFISILFLSSSFLYHSQARWRGNLSFFFFNFLFFCLNKTYFIRSSKR